MLLESLNIPLSVNAIFEFLRQFTIRCKKVLTILRQSTKHANFCSGCSTPLRKFEFYTSFNIKQTCTV